MKPHARAQAEKRIGQAAPVGDPWAARIRAAVFDAYHPWQADVANDPARLWSVLTGRGGGKTTMFKGRYLVEMAETARGKFIYACPTLGMAVELLWEPLKETCSQLGLEPGVDVDFKEAPREGGKIMTLRTGSRLKLFGADDKKQINLCRGQGFHGVGCDEVGFWPSPELVAEFVEQVIMPRTGDYNGWIGLASSPGKVPRGFFYNVTQDGSPDHRPYRSRNEPAFEGWEGFSSHAWSLRDVVALPNAERDYPKLCSLRRRHLVIKNTVKRWGDDNPIWMREYEGRWAADNTTTVFRFDSTKNLWAPQRYEPHTKTWREGALPVIGGLPLLKQAIAALPAGFEWHFVVIADKGSPRAAKEGESKRDGDPWSVNVLTFAPADPQQRVYHVFFDERTGLYARSIAQMLLGADEQGPNGCMPHDKPGGILGIIGWPDAMVMDADESTIAELANVYGLQFEKPPKKPDYKVGAIELTNGDLIDAKIKVIEDSPMHRQLTGLQWAEQDSGALKEDPAQPNHSTDCLIYGREKIATLFESGVVNRENGQGAASSASAGYDDPMGLDDIDDDFGTLSMDSFGELDEGRF